jgi:subtilase family serine protease
LPRADAGWALEISLDVQWAHAIAPGASILLVEATSNRFGDLLAAEDYARTHAEYVSNSWGASEFSGETAYDSYFVQPGVSFFVSAGDNGLPAEYPSSSPNVISVGGTTLKFTSSGTLASETGWSGGGAGVGGPLRRRRHRRRRFRRLRQLDLLSGHHRGQQRSALPRGLRPLYRTRQLARLIP